MRTWTRIGIIILVIGITLFAGTIYRSNDVDSFGRSGSTFEGLAPDAWSPTWSSVTNTYLWAPRELKMEVRCISVLDVYILDSEGIELWNTDGTLEPLWAFEETGQAIYMLQIEERGEYMLLVHNPINESSKYEIHMTIYGIEKDILNASIGAICGGLFVTTFSVIWYRKNKRATTG